MNTIQQYQLWCAHAVEDADLQKELAEMDPDQEPAVLEDHFYRDLAFGTGGLRGIIGAGPNRMNIYVATQGLCNYMKRAGLPLAVAISYDS